MADYQRYANVFIHKGLDLNHPSDLLAQSGRSPLAINIRTYSDGVINQRPGLTAFNAAAIADLNLHSGRQLNNPLASASQTYANFIGAGSALYSDNSAHTTLTQRATGYSGNPLFMMPARPVDSPEPFMYVGDSAKLTKSNVAGTTVQWGVTPTTTPPRIANAVPLFKTIDDFEAATFGSWSVSGPGGPAITNPDRLAAVAITHILYDTGSTGWALVNPASFVDIREGMFVTMSVNAETVPIDSIYKAVTATTIGSIKYDSGTTGLCTIQLTDPTAELTMNSMLRIATAENVRVLSVTYGPNQIPSFRCSTTATRSAGDAVAGLNAFRAYFANTHTTADTLSTKMLQLVTGAAGLTTITRTANFDLSTTNSRPITGSDYVCIQIQLSDPALIDHDIQILCDVDDTTNDFTRNYYFYAIRAADLQPSATQALADITVQQRIAQRTQLDQTLPSPYYTEGGADVQNKLSMLDPSLSGNYDSRYAAPYYEPPSYEPSYDPAGVDTPTTQTIAGLGQWTVLYIPVDRFQRAGSDTSRSWKDVKAIRLAFSATAVITAKVDAWWVGGTYGPNTLSNADAARTPYFYVYRYRSSTTGAKSAPSPPNRSGIEVMRGANVLTPVTSSDTQVDKIDWFRFGGTINSYRYIGTQANSGTYTDTQADDSIDLSPLTLLPTDNDGISLNLQPFPVLDIPRTGVCDVVGTEITRVSGDTFNTNWIRNTPIVINGVPYTLYSSPTSSSRLSLNENAGTQSTVTFYLPSPIIAGQPLDAYFGPWGNDTVTMFGVKDGTLYWTNGNDPDSCAKGNRLEVTSSSEPLMNGCVFDGRPFLFSTERGWEIQPNPDSGFITIVQGYMRGLYARWGITVGDVIYYVYKDGLYSWPGDGGPGGFNASLTADSMKPFFPHDGQVGVTVAGLTPPDFTSPVHLRLSYSDSELYFDYQIPGHITPGYNTLVFKGREAVTVDQYSKPLIFHYASEGQAKNTVYGGSTDGKLYTMGSALADGGVVFTSVFRTPSINDSDPRSKKLLGDLFVEASGVDGQTITAVPYTANYTNTLDPTTITTTGVRNQYILGLPQEPQTLAYNLGLALSWSSATNAQLYDWEFSYLPRPQDTVSRATDFDDNGTLGAKYYQGIRIKADTYGEDRTVVVKYTDKNGAEQTGPTLTVNHDGQSIRDYSFATPFYGWLVRLVPTDDDPWELFSYEFKFQPAPDYGARWETPESTLGLNGFFHGHRVLIPLLSTAEVTMTVVVDGVDTPSGGYAIASTGGSYAKVPFQLVPTKGKSVKFIFTSVEPFRIFQQDVETLFKQWGDAGPFQSLRPFGGPSFTDGASI